MIRILVVDDSATVRDLLARRLGRKGFDVLTASDGQEGVEVARAERPDLVLMDLHMPVMDGWDATRRIKGDPECAEIPVIVLTAYDSSADRSSALSAGCDDFDSKPISMARLLEKIERLLRRSAAHERVP